MYVCPRCGASYDDLSEADWCKREDDLARYADHDTE